MPKKQGVQWGSWYTRPERYPKAPVSENMIRNNSIKLGAIKSPYHIFGPDVPSRKGKNMIRNPSHSGMQYVTVPRQIYGHKCMIIFVADLALHYF